jgi:hypothetical protein
VLLAKYYSGNKIEENEMGVACSAYGGRTCLYRAGSGYLRERDHLEDPSVDERIILKWIFRKLDVGVWTGASWLRMTGAGHL